MMKKAMTMARTMKSKEYWQRRFMALKVDSIRQSANYEHDLTKRLMEQRAQLDADLDKWYERYANTAGDIDKAAAQKLLAGANKRNWQMGLDEFKAKAQKGGYATELDLEYITSRVSRLQELQVQMQVTMSSMALSEQERFAKALGSEFTDTYMKNLYTMNQAGIAVGTNFARYDQNAVDVIISKPWAQRPFRKSVWKNLVNDLPDILTTEISKGVILGYSHTRIERAMHQRLKEFSDSQIHRLVITEMAHVAEEATALSYKAGGIERYEFLATLESHTCETCQKLDGKEYVVDKRSPGSNYPPIHPYCRCTTVPALDDVLKDMPSHRWQRDPKTGKGSLVDDMSYSQWRDMVDGKTPKPVVPKPDVKRRYKPVTQKTVKESTKYIKSLPDDQREAVKAYTDESYRAINRALRNGSSMGAKTASIEANLSKAMQHEIGQDTNVYRGLNKLPAGMLGGLDVESVKAIKKASNLAGKWVDSDKLDALNAVLGKISGAEFTDDGYMSTTRNVSNTKTFSDKVTLDLSVNKEVKGLAVEGISRYASEQEILINKGAKVKVTNIKLDAKLGLVVKGVITNA